jgi:hypothetical protein
MALDILAGSCLLFSFWPPHAFFMLIVLV